MQGRRLGGIGVDMTAHFARSKIETIISTAQSIYVSGAAAEIPDVLPLLRQYGRPEAMTTGIFIPSLNRHSYADPEIGLRARTFFIFPEAKEHLDLGLIDYCPWRYSAIERWMLAPRRFDTALVMLSPPDDSGKCSLGVQADFFPGFRQNVERIVGFINPNMPRTIGDGQIDFRALAAVVDCGAPLTTQIQRTPDAAAVAVAENIAALIPDGATVQAGIGQIPSQVMARLASHRSLRIRSGVVDDNIMALDASGALDPAVPVITGTAVGTERLYRFVDQNRRLSFRAVGHTHCAHAIGGIQRFFAINSVLQVDLFGQSSAESSAGRLVAAPGGLPDFVSGALRSEGGRSIIALRARNAGTTPNGVTACLSMPGLATCGASDADIVVTEFGAAFIRDLSLDRRAEAIVAIAAPEDREALIRDWTRMRKGFFARPERRSNQKGQRKCPDDGRDE
jgi:acyl-CoA hydrolase